jgi:hypothetical protein
VLFQPIIMIGNRARPLVLLAVALACSGEESLDPVEDLELSAVSGNNQTGLAGERLVQAYAVRVIRDSIPVAGVLVRWEVLSGTGTVAPSSSVTDAAGSAQAFHTLGPESGVQEVRASLDRAPGTAVTFVATAEPLLPPLVSRFPVPADYGLHDTFVRDGIAFLSAWNTGIVILDVGAGIRGGAPATPIEISRIVPTAAPLPTPSIHNAWWFHNPVTSEKRYLLVGQEGPAVSGASSSGDIKVLDVSDLAAPREVGFFHLNVAGTHNFWVDETAQVLYAAYYNAGVVALDISGVLQGDLGGRLRALNAPGGPGNTYVWGVMLAGGHLYASDMLSGFWQLDPVTLVPVAGGNNVPERFGSDLWVKGGFAYTGTWGTRLSVLGDAIKVWRLGPTGVPTLADSVIVEGIRTVSDLEVSDNGRLLVVSAEGAPGAGVFVYSLRDPSKPALVGRAPVASGVHTVSLARIGGKLYAFAAKNPPDPALEIYDLSAFDVP